jgi:hypothetical protein
MIKLIQTSLTTCLLLMAAVPIAAQESGTIQAIATVVSSLRVTGMNNLDFGTVIPTDLYTADSSAAMMIDFNATDASYDDGSGGGQIAPAGTLNPNGPSVLNIGNAGSLSIWIGGMVRPTISQTGGDYSADVILIVAYTGG